MPPIHFWGNSSSISNQFLAYSGRGPAQTKATRPRRSTLVDRIAQVPFEPKGGESMLKAKNELLGPNEDLSSAVPMLGTRWSTEATIINARSERSYWVTDDARDFVRNRRPLSPVTKRWVHNQRMKRC